MDMRILALLCCLVCCAALAATEYDEAMHPDGSLHYKIKLDREGQRHGRYTIYHPAGEADRKGEKAEVGRYNHGKLHGERLRQNAEGEVISEEQWLDGTLLLPMTARFIKHQVARIEQAARAAVAELELPEEQLPLPDRERLAAVLARVNHYRLLCGLSTDVGYDVDHIFKAQCAAEVCQGMGKLNHGPKQNPGLSDERWQAGRTGCGKSNLAMGHVGVAAIDAWMDDSDDRNRDRVGHRRWLIWPELKRFGYGDAGTFSAGYVIHERDTSVAQPPVIAFPPRGLMPLDMFGPRYCWSVSPDPARYEVGKDAALEIRPYDVRSGKTGEALELGYRTVAAGNIAFRPAIIALPKSLVLKRGAMYQVTVTGVTAKGEAPELRWVTVFY